MIILGLLLGIIGADVNSGTFRFDFGIAELQDGIDFVAISLGLFGFTEIIVNLSKAKRAIPLQKRSAPFGRAEKNYAKPRLPSRAALCWVPSSAFFPAAELCSLPLLLIRLRRKSAAKTPILRLVKATLPVLPVRNLQQRRRPDELHSDAHARHSLQRYDGFDDRRADDSQHHAGTSGHEL